MKAQESFRKYGINDATLYKYKAKFGGMNVSDAKNLHALDDENDRLKRILGDVMLERGLVRHCSERQLRKEQKWRHAPCCDGIKITEAADCT